MPTSGAWTFEVIAHHPEGIIVSILEVQGSIHSRAEKMRAPGGEPEACMQSKLKIENGSDF